MDRADPPFNAGERETLLGFLEYHRLTLLAKCEGLSDEQLRTPLPPSSLTLAGLLKHAALNEDWWFGYRFAGEDEREPWASAPEDDPDWEIDSARSDPGDELRELYRSAGRRSDEVVAGCHDLSQPTVRALGSGEHPSLRWVIAHMIEETARHNGHADLLREAIDGVTGE